MDEPTDREAVVAAARASAEQDRRHPDPDLDAWDQERMERIFMD